MTTAFSEASLAEVLQSQLETILREINALGNDYVLRTSESELERHYLQKAVSDPLVVVAEQAHIEDTRPTQIHTNDYGRNVSVNATALKIALPYSGDRELWRFRPSTFLTSGFPEIEVRDDSVVITHTFADEGTDQPRLQQEINRAVSALVKGASWSRADLATHNTAAAVQIRATIAAKRRLAEKVSSAIAGLNIPLKKRDTPLTYTIPAARRPSPITKPPVSTQKVAPDPILADEEYGFILRVLKSMSIAMERSPAAFESLDEEAIRMLFLVTLNGHYEGMSTGETFNAAGKTDILIRVENRNVFIAECKFWHGQKSFDEAIDQLLSYLTWRDSKCALLVFNHNRDSTAVGVKMHETMTGRPEWQKTLVEPGGDADPRYVFVKASEPGKELQISTLLFDVPRASVPSSPPPTA